MATEADLERACSSCGERWCAKCEEHRARCDGVILRSHPCAPGGIPDLELMAGELVGVAP